jgi:ATP-dependent DNA ligase
VPRPQFIEPCAPIVSAKPPSGPEWLHEVKWDGWRCQIIKDGEKVSIFSRHRNSWTPRLSNIVAVVRGLPAESLILDGELLSERLDFYTLAHAMRRQEVFVYVFDILHHNGESVRHLPLIKRKNILAETVQAEPLLLISEYFDDGEGLFEACARQNMEGVVSKRRDLPYKSGKCVYWRKSKCEAWRTENKERYKQFERG